MNLKGPPSRGLTLIELVVAMSIFALVAVLGVQSLTGALRLRDRLADTAEATAGLGAATSLLRNDLSAAIPLLFYPAGAAPPRPALDAAPRGEGFALSLGGQPVMSGPAGAPLSAPRQRVEWWVEPGTDRLLRRVWPTLYPAGPDQVSPPAVVMEGVRGLELRTYWTRSEGWVTWPGSEDRPPPEPRQPAFDTDQGISAPEARSGQFPLALEVTLLTRDRGRITLIEALQ